METNGHDVSVFSTVSEWVAVPVLCSVYTVETRRSRLPSGVTSAPATGTAARAPRPTTVPTTVCDAPCIKDQSSNRLRSALSRFDVLASFLARRAVVLLPRLLLPPAASTHDPDDGQEEDAPSDC